MAEQEPAAATNPESGAAAAGRSTNEVALEMMKFIAVTTGYGKVSGAGPGFSIKPQGRTPEDQAEALFDLFERCRKVIKKED